MHEHRKRRTTGRPPRLSSSSCACNLDLDVSRGHPRLAGYLIDSSRNRSQQRNRDREQASIHTGLDSHTFVSELPLVQSLAVPTQQGLVELEEQIVEMASETESEGSGEEIRRHGDPHDSSEDEEDDPEELRKLQEDFIANDDDEAEDDEDLEPEERRRRRKDKRKKRKRSEAAISDEELDEDDLELLAENTGQSGPNKAKAQSQKLKRIRRRGYGSEEDEDEEEPSRRHDRGRGRGDQDEDDLDIFADEPVSTRRGADADELEESDMDDFIEEDDEEENDQMTEAERRTAALAKRAQKKAAAKKHRNFAGAGLE